MYKGHYSYNTPPVMEDFEDIVDEINNEKNNVNVDIKKINKLEEAKLMRQLFSNQNNFNNSNRHFLPW